MRIEQIVQKMSGIIALLVESLKFEFESMPLDSEISQSKHKKQVVQMMQQLSSILQKLHSIKGHESLESNKINKVEDLRIIEDFLKKKKL